MKKISGNPGRRPLNEREPPTTTGIPDPPADLPERVRKQWDKVGPLLVGMGVLTLSDGLALHLLCRAAADYLAYCEAVPVGSDVLLSDAGQPYWNMAASARDKAEARLYKMLLEFGLTPAARSKLQVSPPPDGKDSFEALLNSAGVIN